jgi:hypothetical protein
MSAEDHLLSTIQVTEILHRDFAQKGPAKSPASFSNKVVNIKSAPNFLGTSWKQFLSVGKHSHTREPELENFKNLRH